MELSAVVREFESRFGRKPAVVARAPGRINLIGEHTDYHDGFVFPIAIDRGTWVAADVAQETRIQSAQLGKESRFEAKKTQPSEVIGWASYPAGMAWSLREEGIAISEIDALVLSDVPIGSGVSSSAALELAFGLVWTNLSGQNLDRTRLAEVAQRAENAYVGMPCGIMDQMASAHGKAGQAMFLDTRSKEIEYAPIPDDLAVVLCDTRASHALKDGQYAIRRRQSFEAARKLEVAKLRDATFEAVQGDSSQEFALTDLQRRRARHIVTENARAVAFRDALAAGDRTRVGELMRASHESLRDDYEVSCPELDAMAEACWDAPGCVGARMTGGGFGGACVAIVFSESLEDFCTSVRARYRQQIHRHERLLLTSPAEGAQVY